MTPVLNWIKANVVIVIFVALMIAAAITLPLLASSMNAGVKLEVDNRMKKSSQLDAVKSVSIEQPGGAKTVALNKDMHEAYDKYLQAKMKDARETHDIALVHNRKDRSLLLPALFPQPQLREREVLPERFVGLLNDAYDALLQQVRAGSPPSQEKLADELDAVDSNFRVGTLKKGETEALTPEETLQLQNELASARMSRAAQSAETIGIYLSRDALAIPVWVHSRSTSLAELFDWQWQLWINQDILRALHELNKSYPSVVTAPVKRVTSVRIQGLATGSAQGGAAGTGAGGSTTGGSGMPGRRQRTGGFGAPPGSDGGDGEAPTGEESGEEPVAPPAGGRGPAGRAPEGTPPLGAPTIDRSAEAALDYRFSFTGRKTNQLYDVRYVELGVVVETAAIPRVLEALSQHNFMTVLDVAVNRATIFDAVRNGFFYGDAPVSELTILVETVWLREWTAPLMPPDLRALLEIKSDPAGAAG